MQKILSELVVASLVAGNLLLPAPAYAQALASSETEGTSRRETIVVTGARAEDGQARAADAGALGSKTLLDTPYSVTVVDKDAIAKRQANSIGQLFEGDPSISSSAPSAAVNWWGTQIRGLGVRNYYIDDVPLLLYWGGDFPLEPVESVTALKGLTGFMYGFGSPGGVISYRTKRPTAEPLLTTEIGYRTGSVVYGRLDAGGPLSADGRLGYRVNLAAEQGTAYNKAGVNRLVGSLALDYAITPQLKWHATATYEDSKLEHEPFQFYWTEYTGAQLPRPTYDYDNLNVANSYYQARTLATATGLDWQFASNWSARLTYGYTSKQHHSNKMFVYMQTASGDYDGYAYNFAELDRNHFAQAMVQGDFRTGPIRHQIVAGLSYQVINSEFGYTDSNYYWGNDFNGNIYRDQPFLVTRAIDYSTDGWPSRERHKAAFFSDTLSLGQHLQAIVGARYTHYALLDVDNDPTTDSGYRTSAITPTVALIYKPAPYVSLYASYVEAMEPGTRVSGEYANAGEVLKATRSRQYEAGMKYEHRALSMSLAGFRIERVNTADRVTAGERRLTQDGLTLYKGIEGIANYQISPDLNLGIGAVFLDPTIRDVSAGSEDLLGNVPADASKWQATGRIDYGVSAVPGLSLHGSVRYTGRAPTSDANTLYVPAYTTANVGFQFATAIAGKAVIFTGNVNNILDTKYWTQTNIGEGINASLSARISW